MISTVFCDIEVTLNIPGNPSMGGFPFLFGRRKVAGAAGKPFCAAFFEQMPEKEMPLKREIFNTPESYRYCNFL